MAPALLYVDPNNSAAKAAAKATGEDKRLLELLAAQPTSKWLGEWTTNPEVDVRRLLDTPRVRSLVVYNIPQRDGENHSKGGAKTATEYRSFISAVARGINGKACLVILEPDALAYVSDAESGWGLSPAALKERYALLSEAIGTLSRVGARVYLDAGDSNWIPPRDMADRLARAGVNGGAGFALNVSHNEWLANEALYAQRLRYILGPARKYLIDTSRNGLGPLGSEWCNAPLRGCGEKPTLSTGIEGCDGFLWVKPVGDSDGPCHGGPAAGKFWTEYAVGLAERANPRL